MPWHTLLLQLSGVLQQTKGMSSVHSDFCGWLAAIILKILPGMRVLQEAGMMKFLGSVMLKTKGGRRAEAFGIALKYSSFKYLGKSQQASVLGAWSSVHVDVMVRSCASKPPELPVKGILESLRN